MTAKAPKYNLTKCAREWLTLKIIDGNSRIRHCGSCNKSVHWCETEKNLIEAMENKWCIAAENSLINSDANEMNGQSYYVGGIEPSYLVEVVENKGFVKPS